MSETAGDFGQNRVGRSEAEALACVNWLDDGDTPTA